MRTTTGRRSSGTSRGARSRASDPLVAVAADADRVATGYESTTQTPLRIHQLPALELVKSLEWPEDVAWYAPALSPDGETLAVVVGPELRAFPMTEARRLEVWSLAGPKRVLEVPLGVFDVAATLFSPSSDTLVVATEHELRIIPLR